MFTKALTLFLLPAIATAQYGYTPPSGGGSSSSSSNSSPPANNAANVPTAPADTPGHMNIDVAFQGNFMFHPNNITAPVGTLVTFYFPNSGITHSVTQSSFANPCTYLAASGNSSAGFDSGLTASTSFTLNVTSTDPIWFFCKQVQHCGMGMVGSINAPSSGNTFQSFQSAAMSLGTNAPAAPTQSFVAGGVNGVATAAPSSDVGQTGGNTGSGAATIAVSGALGVVAAAMAAILI